MWLVLCHSGDVAALWLYNGLRQRGLKPLQLVSAEVLACSRLWEHRLAAGHTTVDITLHDGRAIHGDGLRGVVNRLVAVPMDLWRRASPADRAYVLQELTAFYVSWLMALPCPVLNRPSPLGLAGAWRHQSHWVWLAARAGLRTPDYIQSSQNPIDRPGALRRRSPPPKVKTVLVIGDRVVGGQPPGALLAGCLELARVSGSGILGVDFADGPEGEWTFVGATPLPDLRLGGEAALDALMIALHRERRESL